MDAVSVFAANHRFSYTAFTQSHGTAHTRQQAAMQRRREPLAIDERGDVAAHAFGDLAFGDHHGEVADPHAHDHEARQQVDQLHRFIHAQPPLDRALLLLYLDDRSHRDIAEILGLSETNVATKISRLKQRLRQEL